jgi:hypothetical protein
MMLRLKILMMNMMNVLAARILDEKILGAQHPAHQPMMVTAPTLHLHGDEKDPEMIMKTMVMTVAETTQDIVPVERPETRARAHAHRTIILTTAMTELDEAAQETGVPVVPIVKATGKTTDTAIMKANAEVTTTTALPKQANVEVLQHLEISISKTRPGKRRPLHCS